MFLPYEYSMYGREQLETKANKNWSTSVDGNGGEYQELSNTQAFVAKAGCKYKILC